MPPWAPITAEGFEAISGALVLSVRSVTDQPEGSALLRTATR